MDQMKNDELRPGDIVQDPNKPENGLQIVQQIHNHNGQIDLYHPHPHRVDSGGTLVFFLCERVHCVVLHKTTFAKIGNQNHVT